MTTHESPTHEQRSILARDLFGKPFNALSDEQRQSVFDSFFQSKSTSTVTSEPKSKPLWKSVWRTVIGCVFGLIFVATLFNVPWKITQKRSSQITSTTTVYWYFWEQPAAHQATAEIRWDIVFLEWGLIGGAFWLLRLKK